MSCVLIVNKYRLDTSKPEDLAEYKRIVAKCRELGYRCMSVSNFKPDFIEDLPASLELEPEYIFADQYNAGGFRVHDWYEQYGEYKHRKVGYYLTGDLDELARIKSEHYVCRFCGHRHQGHDAPVTCPKCLGSPYLKESDLRLTTMQPLTGPKRAEVIPAAEYAKAQAEAKARYAVEQQARRVRVAAEIVNKAKDDAAALVREAEYKAAVLLAGLDIDNLIHYRHSDEWVWGWREPCTQEESERIRSTSLPFDYTIKMRDGTTR